MQPITRNENKCLFEALLHFLAPLNITVEINEKSTVKEENTKKKGIDLNAFSFFQSMEASKGIKGSLSDVIIQERKEDYR